MLTLSGSSTWARTRDLRINSKKYQRQVKVAAEVPAGDRRIVGVMIESHLKEGCQDIVPGQALQPGVSVTDACISFEQTLPVQETLARAVRARRVLV